MITKKRLPKPCKRCGKTFEPTGKFCIICDKCIKEKVAPNHRKEEEPEYIKWICNNPDCGYTYKVSNEENKDLKRMLCPRCKFRNEMHPIPNQTKPIHINPQDNTKNKHHKVRNKHRSVLHGN